MHKARVSAETKHYVHCPNCGARAGQIDHMAKGEWRGRDTRWSCDACGVPYGLQVNSLEDVKVETVADKGINVPCLHLLMLAPQPTPVYVVVKSHDYGRGGRDNKKPFSGLEYFYNEHTCPTNWTDQIEMIVHNGDGDPHGLFQYVSSVDLPQEEPDDLDEFIQSAFPDIFEPESANAEAKD
jgi:hypothetical protein